MLHVTKHKNDRHTLSLGRKALSQKRLASGFTLVEILVSLVILALVFTAISTMNFTSITSFTSARDSTEATFIGQKTMTMIEAEAEQWRGKNRGSNTLTGLYTSDTGLKRASLLSLILASGNLQWVELTADLPFSSTGDANTANSTGRFCVAGRHIDFPNSTPTSLQGARIQIAVYYPGPSQKQVDSCTQLNDGNVQNLSQGTSPGAYLLREKGTRSEFFSFIVTPPTL